MDCHHTPSEFQHLVWNRSNFSRIGLKGPASMIWWCDCGTSLGLSSYGMQMFLLHLVAYTNLQFLYSGKGAMIQRTKWQWHLEWKGKPWTASFQSFAFVMWRQFVISNQWAISVLCKDCHTSAWWHIEITENEFSIWVSCLWCFQHWVCGTKHQPWNECSLCKTERQ